MTADEFEELLAECLRRIDEGGVETLEEFSLEHPAYADRLRRRVQNLLEVDLLGHATTKSMAGGEMGRGEPALERVGPFKILDVLGEGGMGTVYLAEQKEPVRRRVALKIIKLGMDSKQVLHRFEVERQALAMMEHSSIAKVYEAGTTDRGQPYFVMEYVKGIPITDHCDQHNVSIEGRLELFRKICAGVQHAHQKGVMHRDLKPSNVLVSVQEGEAMPKIIDFGLARATDHRLTQATMFTEQGRIVGTPEYMSPEQAGLGGQDIDTRTDVYSLGVLLYELLVGELPFPAEDLRRAGFGEMERKIKEDDPPKPSTRLSSSSDGSEHAARRRRTDTRSLVRRLRTDLDWVVMKAIEKDRTRRYDTPAALADDLHRHLKHEPVLAGPPSAGYQLRKLVRRYRTQTVAASLILLTLVGGIIGTSIGFTRARDSEILANQRSTDLAAALDEAEVARAAEAEQRETAVAEASRATVAEELANQRVVELEQVTEFQATQIVQLDPEKMAVDLRDGVVKEARAAMERSGLDGAAIEERSSRLKELLAGANFTNLALDTLEANFFARALAAIDTQFVEQPRVMAQLLQASAYAMKELGLLELAAEPQQRALAIRRSDLGDEHLDTLASVNSMGALLVAQGKRAEAEPYLVEALEATRRLLGDDHHLTLSSISSMGWFLHVDDKLDEAEQHYLDALEGQRRVLGDEHPSTLTSIANLGGLLYSRSEFAEAEPYYREALDTRRRVLGDEHPDTLTSIALMGMVLQRQGKLDEAEPYHREALEVRRRVLGDDHPETVGSINNMGYWLQAQGKNAEAEPFLLEALEVSRRVLGASHPRTLQFINNVGAVYQRQGEFDAAEPYLREALTGRRRVLGDEHSATLMSISNMGLLRLSRAEFAVAERLLSEALEGQRNALGGDHPETLFSIYLMGVMFAEQGKLDQAEPYFREALELRRNVLGDDHSATLESTTSMGRVLVLQGKFDEAAETYREAIQRLRRLHGAEHPLTLQMTHFLRDIVGNMTNRAAQLHVAGDDDAAEPLVRHWLEISRTGLGDRHPQTAGSMAVLGMVLIAKEGYEEAEFLLRECLQIRQQVLPSDSWMIHNTRSLLGGSLVGQGEYAEAEPLLRQGYEQMKPPENASMRKRDAAKRLVELYEAWDKPEQASKWRAELKRIGGENR